LPNLYSHYGSRGIVLMTILQSWSQGVDVWGESGMKKLWSAANVAVYSGGVKEREFLDMLSALIGDYDKRTASVSTGRGHRSINHQLTANLVRGRQGGLAPNGSPLLPRLGCHLRGGVSG
ncbi:MAG: TraG/TraD/VirD4 family protein, partial [Dermatophilaceae bacterium]